MKKNLLIISALVFGLSIQAQQKNSGLEMGLGFGAGLYVGDYTSSLLNVTGNVEADYFLAPQISIFGHLDYNRTFSTESSDAGSFGFATSHIGPRVHFAKVFFVGAGAGTLFETGDGGSSWHFSYLPQVGAVLNHTELSFGYKGWLTTFGNSTYNNGILELGVIFKLNRIIH
jgi:hypothetical protein